MRDGILFVAVSLLGFAVVGIGCSDQQVCKQGTSKASDGSCRAVWDDDLDVDGDGIPNYLDEDDLDEIIESHLVNGKPVERLKI